jgi:hypothetical protein
MVGSGVTTAICNGDFAPQLNIAEAVKRLLVAQLTAIAT